MYFGGHLIHILSKFLYAESAESAETINTKYICSILTYKIWISWRTEIEKFLNNTLINHNTTKILVNEFN